MTDILTIEDAPNYLNVHPITLYRMLKRGDLPAAFKVGRVWRIPLAELDRFTRENWLPPKR